MHVRASIRCYFRDGPRSLLRQQLRASTPTRGDRVIGLLATLVLVGVAISILWLAPERWIGWLVDAPLIVGASVALPRFFRARARRRDGALPPGPEMFVSFLTVASSWAGLIISTAGVFLTDPAGWRWPVAVFGGQALWWFGFLRFAREAKRARAQAGVPV